MWISRQRLNVLPESERGQKLLQIGMRFGNKWEETYEYAQKYYKHNGNLKVSRNFKTNNGYDYDEEGIVNLGVWISIQRQKILPESAYGRKLFMIGMIWNVKANREKVFELSNISGINIEKNKNILSKISYQELKSKILFLKENDISLVDKNGKFHEIFYLKDNALKALKYIILD